jgi:hypothetical protein
MQSGDAVSEVREGRLRDDQVHLIIANERLQSQLVDANKVGRSLGVQQQEAARCSHVTAFEECKDKY